MAKTDRMGGGLRLPFLLLDGMMEALDGMGLAAALRELGDDPLLSLSPPTETWSCGGTRFLAQGSLADTFHPQPPLWGWFSVCPVPCGGVLAGEHKEAVFPE